MIRQTITKTDMEKFKLDMLKTDKSENTRKKYIRDITEFQAYLSDESVKLSNAVVVAYVKHLLDAGYSISSVNSVISAINNFCSFIDRTDIHCAYLKKKRLAVVPRAEEESASVEWDRVNKQGKWVNKNITSVDFVENLYHLMGWNRECRYKVLCRVAASDRGLILVFEMEEAIMFAPKKEEFVDPVTGETKNVRLILSRCL